MKKSRASFEARLLFWTEENQLGTLPSTPLT
jgi:hypothetical protein